METGNEIRSAINNIRFYAKKIEELAKQQFDRDCEIAQITGINTEPGGIRFECLGCISTAANWMKLYCDNIETNVKSAEEQDQKLRPLPEEQPDYEKEVKP